MRHTRHKHRKHIAPLRLFWLTSALLLSVLAAAVGDASASACVPALC
ncbi:hypothetical protein [Humidesulfovibrio mexicanus]|nr:hypothetical protein [Humidesulfovibrio mexicanus]